MHFCRLNLLIPGKKKTFCESAAPEHHKRSGNRFEHKSYDRHEARANKVRIVSLSLSLSVSYEMLLPYALLMFLSWFKWRGLPLRLLRELCSNIHSFKKRPVLVAMHMVWFPNLITVLRLMVPRQGYLQWEASSYRGRKAIPLVSACLSRKSKELPFQHCHWMLIVSHKRTTLLRMSEQARRSANTRSFLRRIRIWWLKGKSIQTTLYWGWRGSAR